MPFVHDANPLWMSSIEQIVLACVGCSPSRLENAKVERCTIKFETFSLVRTHPDTRLSCTRLRCLRCQCCQFEFSPSILRQWADSSRNTFLYFSLRYLLKLSSAISRCSIIFNFHDMHFSSDSPPEVRPPVSILLSGCLVQGLRESVSHLGLAMYCSICLMHNDANAGGAHATVSSALA
jgi:hypothetical protein